MNNEIKKNKKMVLALVIVAALAMVSVAAIAIHSDDSSAAGSGMYVPMNGGNSFAIDATITTDCEFYVDVGDSGTIPIEITANANYTGTLTIGTLDKSVTPWDYVPYASMKLTNASNVDMTALIGDMNGVTGAFFRLVNPSVDAQVDNGVYGLTAAPSGTFELTQGAVQIGTDADNFFNGTVTAGDLTVTTEFAYGAILGISDDGTGLISGYVRAGNMADPDPAPTGWDRATDLPTPTLTLAGTGSVQFPVAMQQIIDAAGANRTNVLRTSDVEVTIADGAVITAGDRAPSLATDVTINGTDIQEALLFDATNPDANGYWGDVNGTNDAVTFYDVPLGTYALYMVANTDYVYYATVTVTATGITLSSNTLPITLMADDAFDISGAGDLTYEAGAYTFISAVNISTWETGTATVDNGTSIGTITFPEYGFSGSDYFLAVMLNRGTGIQEVFLGNVGSNDAGGVLKATTATTFTSDDQIRGGTVNVAPAISTFTVMKADTVHIFGTLNLLYTSEDQYGAFNIMAQAKVNLDVDGGKIIQGVKPPANGSLTETPVSLIFGSANLVTAYYFTNDTTGTPAVATYYLTSLANAIKESNQVTLFGDIVILEDLTLSSPNADPLTVIIGPGASLQVGREYIDDDTPAVSAILTIPDGTTVLNPYGQRYEVKNGQAVYDVKPTPHANEPISDVLIAGNNKFIYTDLATALDISTGNVTIDTLRPATLMRSATVNTGVTLNDTNGITIPDKMTLTVNGTVVCTAGMTITGTLLINNIVNFNNGTVTLTGSIVIAENGTLNLKGNTLNGGADSVLVVDGTLNMTAASTAKVNTMYFEGTATITDLTVNGVLRIGAVPKLSTGYTNSAVLTAGKLTLGPTAVAWVYGSFDGKAALTNTVISTVYMINATTYLTIYVVDANTTQNLPFVYGDEFGADGYMLDIQINDWNNARNGRGDNLSVNGPSSANPAFVGDANWETVYADWSAKQYKVSFNYMPGVTWSCNGQTVDSSNNTVLIDYGASISVQVFVQPGYQGTPVIQKDGTAVSGNPYTTTVTGNVNFSVKDGSVQVADTGTTSTDNNNGGLSLIEILLIIIVIIIAIIAIIIAIRLLRS